MKRIIIGGGSGFIGRALAKYLEQLGNELSIISRAVISAENQTSSYSWDEIRCSGLPTGTDVVISMAGRNFLDPFFIRKWDNRYIREVESSRVETTRCLANAIVAAKHKPSLFISCSGVGYYRPSVSAEYTEESEGGDFDFLSRLCTKWEEAARLPNDLSTRTVIARLGVVLGRDGGIIERLKVPFRFGLGGPLGSGSQWFPWIHIHDACSLFNHIIGNQTINGIVNFTSPSPVTYQQFASSYGKALNRPACLPFPEFMVRLLYHPDQYVTMLEGQKVLPKRALDTGFQFEYPDIDTACEEIVKNTS